MEAQVKPGFAIARYRRRFALPDGEKGEVVARATMSGLCSELWLDGRRLATDFTPAAGLEGVRNHLLAADLPGGRIEVEAGYVNMWAVGIAVRLDGKLVHESHPGRTMAIPEAIKKMMISEGGKDGKAYDTEVWQRSKVPLSVDIGTGLLFFVIAKLTNLTTAALAGAVVGLLLYVIQRRTKIDLLGGLAMFGIVMLLFSAALALIFQSDDAVKLRTTIVGLVGSALFLADGLFGGNRIGKRMAHYLPYQDLMPHRLAIGMGVMGIVMAGLNLVVARLFSTDIWLFYTTFLDTALILVMIFAVFAYARGKLFPPRPVAA